MKKSTVIIDRKNETITMTKAYYKRACIFNSDEYVEYNMLMERHQGFKIVFKAKDKKTYADLTFAVMEEYIKTQPNYEHQLVVFEAVKRVAAIKGSKYPLTKKWFLKTYPEYKLNEATENETKTLEESITAELEALEAEDNKVVSLANAG